MSSRSLSGRLCRAVLVGLLAWLGVAGVPTAVAAQETSDTQAGHELEARILAQRHDNGNVEFVMQFREQGGPWSESAPPTRRFLPPDVEVDRWAVSSPLTVTANPDDPTTRAAVEVRIAARRLANDRVEFALQIRAGATWGERLLPAQRFFRLDTEVGRWLASSSLAVTFPPSVPGSDVNLVPVSDDVLDFEMIDVHSGETVNIRSVITGETPLLFWLWSPY